MATRALVLSADVGEGHVAAARALGEGLRALDDTVVAERDGLAAFGAVGRRLIRDGYRFQLRFMPWSFAAMYWVVTHCGAVRRLGAFALSMLARRRLARLLRRERPDVVVSTHPAITCVLGRMRTRRMVEVPLCATVTDLADYVFWAHPGADLHLVPHPAALDGVERVAGPGSAALVRSLIGRRFEQPLSAPAARQQLGLPVRGGIVAVSGGGWAFGDLAGSAEAALAAGARVVIVLAGRDGDLEQALHDRFAGEPRVRVWGFTERMPELMRAADGIVHSTGGMTSLEAIATGCPLVALGRGPGHIGVHNRALQQLGLISISDDRGRLTDVLRSLLESDGYRDPVARQGADAAHLVRHAIPRVRQLPRLRLAGERAVSLLACAAVGIGTLATDDAYSVVRPLGARPINHVVTRRHEVGLVVRAPAAGEAPIAAGLATAGIRASFASSTPPPRGTITRLRRLGDEAIPELRAPGLLRWVRTRGKFGEGDDPVHRYLAPAGMGLGQYLLARSAGWRPVQGRVRTLASGVATAPAPRAGDIVVVTEDGGRAQLSAGLRELRGRLLVGGLAPVPLSQLIAGSSSTTRRTAGEDSSARAAATTTAMPASTPGAPRGV